MISPDVDDPFKSIVQITESIKSNNEEFKTDERTIGNNTNGNNKVSTNINGKSTKKLAKKKKNQNCDSSCASIQE